MRFRSKAVAKVADSAERAAGSFLLVESYREHQLCDKPNFTPWSSPEDKFGPGSIWQCGECQNLYLVTGDDPVVGGFWTKISARKAKRLLKQSGKYRLIP